MATAAVAGWELPEALAAAPAIALVGTGVYLGSKLFAPDTPGVAYHANPGPIGSMSYDAPTSTLTIAPARDDASDPGHAMRPLSYQVGTDGTLREPWTGVPVGAVVAGPAQPDGTYDSVGVAFNSATASEVTSQLGLYALGSDDAGPRQLSDSRAAIAGQVLPTGSVVLSLGTQSGLPASSAQLNVNANNDRQDFSSTPLLITQLDTPTGGAAAPATTAAVVAGSPTAPTSLADAEVRLNVAPLTAADPNLFGTVRPPLTPPVSLPEMLGYSTPNLNLPISTGAPPVTIDLPASTGGEPPVRINLGSVPFPAVNPIPSVFATQNSSSDPTDVYIDPSKYPQVASHIQDAILNGAPDVLTIGRDDAAARRRAATSGVATAPKLDRDEYPPAVSQQGGAGSSVRLIAPSDNRGAGASMGGQIQSLPDGSTIRIVIGPKP